MVMVVVVIVVVVLMVVLATGHTGRVVLKSSQSHTVNYKHT